MSHETLPTNPPTTEPIAGLAPPEIVTYGGHEKDFDSPIYAELDMNKPADPSNGLDQDGQVPTAYSFDDSPIYGKMISEEGSTDSPIFFDTLAAGLPNNVEPARKHAKPSIKHAKSDAPHGKHHSTANKVTSYDAIDDDRIYRQLTNEMQGDQSLAAESPIYNDMLENGPAKQSSSRNRTDVARPGRHRKQSEELREPMREVHHVTLRDIEPITDSTPKGMKARLKRMMGRAAELYKRSFDSLTSRVVEHPEGDLNAAKTPVHKLVRERLSTAYAAAGAKTEAGIQTAIEYFSDQEKGKRRQAVAWVAGIVAIGATTYLSTKGLEGHSGTQHGSTAHEALNSGSGHHHVQDGHGALQTPGHHSGEGQSDAAHLDTAHGLESSKDVVRMKHGDSVWNIGRQNLINHGTSHPSPDQLLAESRRILALNHISWLEARDLDVGTEIKLI